MNPTQPFTDPAMITRYTEDTPRKIPGFLDFHRMMALLLAEQAPVRADILVLGAGGGLELKSLAEAQPGWRFVGVDPSTPMLELASRVTEAFQSRVQLQQGYIDDAPLGPFDGATCLLTLHFLAWNERLRTLREIHRRLKPSARLVVMHHSYPVEGERSRWLTRFAAFACRSEGELEGAPSLAAALAEHLPMLSVAEDEAAMREAGFTDIAMFYAGFTFRGWVATAVRNITP